MSSMPYIPGSNCRAVLLISCIMLLLCTAFRHPAVVNTRQFRNIVHSYNNDYIDVEVDNELTIQEEIKGIIKIFVDAPGGIGSINPTVLMDNAHILTKGKLYEYVIDKTIQECDNNRDIAKIEQVDAFMRGFIVSERKQRSRLKINYVMSGASSNRLDEAISLLSER